ncbi:MAG: hypothetical protein FWD25_03015 [Clostridia bacterium]|nr:hypothetical protein [Clostridia bacterium]
MKDGVDYRIGPGMTSLLMIFFVLCMAALAILTLQSVQVEGVLNKRTANATVAYYEAALQVERQLADIDTQLAEARAAANGDAEAYAASLAVLQASLTPTHASNGNDIMGFAPDVPNNALPLCFSVLVGENGQREIQVILHVPMALTGPRYAVARRMLVNIGPWDAEQSVGFYVPGSSD